MAEQTNPVSGESEDTLTAQDWREIAMEMLTATVDLYGNVLVSRSYVEDHLQDEDTLADGMAALGDKQVGEAFEAYQEPVAHFADTLERHGGADYYRTDPEFRLVVDFSQSLKEVIVKHLEETGQMTADRQFASLMERNFGKETG